MALHFRAQCGASQQKNSHPGRPRMHPGGWEQSIKRICISKTAYSKWSHMKESQGFTKDDEVALYLLSLYEQNDTDDRYGQ